MAKIGRLNAASNGSTSASRVEVEKRNTKATLLALLLGLTVGGMVIGGLVATTNAQHNAGAVQPYAVSELNALGKGYGGGVPTTGGGLSPVSRADEAVLVSESKCLEDLDTQQGSIQFIGGNWVYPLPLCINNDTLAGWYADYLVVGGYTPHDGRICVFQGKEWYQGTVYLSWKWIRHDASCGEVWETTFYVKQDFTLDSNQYPTLVNDPVAIDTNGHTTIPGKAVDLYIKSEWSGCKDRSQDFTIISAQLALVLSNILPILSP
jgi:hypothetical protein